MSEPAITRRDLERALRGEIKLEPGLSHRASRKAVAILWPMLVGEQRAELDELREIAAQLASVLDGRAE